MTAIDDYHEGYDLISINNGLRIWRPCNKHYLTILINLHSKLADADQKLKVLISTRWSKQQVNTSKVRDFEPCAIGVCMRI